MVRIKEVICAYCGAYTDEMRVTDPADGLHHEYDMNLKNNPKYCCHQCSIITEINRAYGDIIKGKKTPLETAKVIRKKAEYIKKNGNAITDHYLREWQKTDRRRHKEQQQNELEEKSN